MSVLHLQFFILLWRLNTCFSNAAHHTSVQHAAQHCELSGLTSAVDGDHENPRSGPNVEAKRKNLLLF